MSTNILWFIERNGVRIRYTHIQPKEEDFYVSNIKTYENCLCFQNKPEILTPIIHLQYQMIKFEPFENVDFRETV